MNRPDLSLLPVLEALQVLQTWLAPKMPPKIQHQNEKASDAEVVAVAILQQVRALANLALGAQVIGPLALTLIGLFFCQSRAEVILGGQTSLLSLFGLSFSGFLL